MSQVTGNVVLMTRDVLPDVPGHVVASGLALITGAIILFFGLARLGWVVEFIPLPAICAFMTGSAINIISTQAPKLMGIKGVNTREPSYRLIVDTLRKLPTTQLDAALGLTALAMLYLVRAACTYMAKRRPQRAKAYFFASTLRTVFVILLYTAISAAVNVSHMQRPRFAIIKEVPRGQCAATMGRRAMLTPPRLPARRRAPARRQHHPGLFVGAAGGRHRHAD